MDGAVVAAVAEAGIVGPEGLFVEFLSVYRTDWQSSIPNYRIKYFLLAVADGVERCRHSESHCIHLSIHPPFDAIRIQKI